MPRVTRAALRSVEQRDESGIAPSTPLPQTSVKGRVPLGETAGNQGVEREATNSPEEKVTALKKGIGKGKKANVAKRSNRPPKQEAEEMSVEVLEDENQSIHSSAAEEASQDLLKDGSKGTAQVIIDSDRPQTPPSAAASIASEQLSPNPMATYFDSDVQKIGTITADDKEEKEDSFVAKIESRTPLKMTNSAGIEEPSKDESNGDDSFVEQIKTRTPGKRISRIEDSVAALDALEEEIEKVGESIPAGADGLHVKTKKQAKPQSATAKGKASDSMRLKRSTDIHKEIGTGRSSTAVGPATSSASAGAMNTRARPRTSLAQGKTKIATQAVGSTRKAGQPVPQADLKQRVSSIYKAPFQPTKSTKPPTRASFELPGDAVARKLKEQREERLKREEEETPKPKVFKARPVRVSHAPEVKLTAATKARLSMAKGESINRARPSNSLGNSKPVARPGPMATVSPNKRLSTFSIANNSTQPTVNDLTKSFANSSARLTRGPSLNASTSVRAPSALGANRPAPTAQESAHQKLKGKEVFGRTKVEIMEREKAKKEKEDAARKARDDAAERGRIASRKWAEKHKARKLEAGKENN